MVKVRFKQIDLLRKRRSSASFAEPYFIDTKKYIKKGIISGLILIAISLILGIPFIFKIKILENKKSKFKVFGDQYDLLEKKLDEESKELKKIRNFNNKLKNSIVNISSSSALFKEISLIIPKEIQLLDFESKRNTLNMKAKLSGKKYLETINYFLLNLDKSEFIEFDEIDLKEIKVSNEILNGKSNEKSYLFNINTKVSTKYSDINDKYLIKLGANGLVNRLSILRNIETEITK